MKKSLLFVDDDVNVLNGLRRVFHNERDRWDMHFACSGAEALDIMELTPVDIIITDINMPGLDGIRLLKQVTDHYPGTTRMVLSGRSDADLILKAVAVTHQFLSKPCVPEILKLVIERAEESKSLLQSDDLKQLVSKLGALPSAPSLFREIADELQSPEASIQKVAEIVSHDPSMAAKVLQLANSALFGRRRSVSKIPEAVSYLGMKCVAELILAIQAFAQFQPASKSFSIEEFQMHGNFTAVRAKRIAEEQNATGQTKDDSFTAGLLHDIGKLILASRLPKEYADAVFIAAKSQMPMLLAEHETFSATHAEVGAYLLALWGLPDAIVEAAAYHHFPAAATKDHFSALNAVHAANTVERLTDSVH
jgi:HD-like signal output (HDOD) protein